MGKLLLYKAGRIAQSLQCRSYNSDYSPTTAVYKDINGTEYTTIYHTTAVTSSAQIKSSLSNTSIYDEITGYLSADTENDFDISDYTTNELSDISCSRTSTLSQNGKVYTIQATNNGANSVTIGSIKFLKNIFIDSISNTGTCLIFGYFLDTPVTLGVGETKTFAINLDFVAY